MYNITKCTLLVLNLNFDHLALCSLSTEYHKFYGFLHWTSLTVGLFKGGLIIFLVAIHISLEIVLPISYF